MWVRSEWILVETCVVQPIAHTASTAHSVAQASPCRSRPRPCPALCPHPPSRLTHLTCTCVQTGVFLPTWATRLRKYISVGGVWGHRWSKTGCEFSGGQRLVNINIPSALRDPPVRSTPGSGMLLLHEVLIFPSRSGMECGPFVGNGGPLHILRVGGCRLYCYFLRPAARIQCGSSHKSGGNRSAHDGI